DPVPVGGDDPQVPVGGGGVADLGDRVADGGAAPVRRGFHPLHHVLTGDHRQRPGQPAVLLAFGEAQQQVADPGHGLGGQPQRLGPPLGAGVAGAQYGQVRRADGDGQFGGGGAQPRRERRLAGAEPLRLRFDVQPVGSGQDGVHRFQPGGGERPEGGLVAGGEPFGDGEVAAQAAAERAAHGDQERAEHGAGQALQRADALPAAAGGAGQQPSGVGVQHVDVPVHGLALGVGQHHHGQVGVDGGAGRGRHAPHGSGLVKVGAGAAVHEALGAALQADPVAAAQGHPQQCPPLPAVGGVADQVVAGVAAGAQQGPVGGVQQPQAAGRQREPGVERVAVVGEDEQRVLGVDQRQVFGEAGVAEFHADGAAGGGQREQGGGGGARGGGPPAVAAHLV